MEIDSRRELTMNSVLRRVMWGEDRLAILGVIRNQGYAEGEAQAMLDAAEKERIAAIRGIHWPKIGWGLVFVGLGIGVIAATYLLTEGYGVWSGRAVIVPLAPFAYGAWKILCGVTGILTASTRTGPVSDIG